MAAVSLVLTVVFMLMIKRQNSEDSPGFRSYQ
jgi:hypothetical protein